MGGRITATQSLDSRATSTSSCRTTPTPSVEYGAFSRRSDSARYCPHRSVRSSRRGSSCSAARRTAIDGVSFEEAWATRIEDELDGLKVGFISRELLLKNKLAAGRDKVLADAKMLERLMAADEDRG